MVGLTSAKSPRSVWNNFGYILEQQLTAVSAILVIMDKHRILVVDDEPNVAFFFQQHLQLVDESYMATAVNSGADALIELKKQPYDLLITDLRMPKMNGLELLQHVRKISPKTKTILVTAYGSDDVWERARQLDISRGLSKPVKINELLATVKELLVQTPASSKTNRHSGLLVLSGERFETLFQIIEQLRSEIGAHAGILSDTTGRILATAGSTDDIDISSMMALLGGTMAASSEMLQRLAYPNQFHFSYFEGPPYDLYAAYLGQGFFLTLIYDRRRGHDASRIGMVWLYTRRAVDKLSTLLQQDVSDDADLGLGTDFAGMVEGELDSMLGLSALSAPAATPQPKPATTTSLQEKVEQLLKQFAQSSSLAVTWDLSGLDRPLVPEAIRLLFRALTVCLKNIQQHAQASTVSIEFKRDGQQLNGRIQDNGQGCAVNQIPSSSTLANLQKMFKKAQGNLLFSSQPGQGTTVRFDLPL